MESLLQEDILKSIQPINSKHSNSSVQSTLRATNHTVEHHTHTTIVDMKDSDDSSPVKPMKMSEEMTTSQSQSNTEMDLLHGLSTMNVQAPPPPPPPQQQQQQVVVQQQYRRLIPYI